MPDPGGWSGEERTVFSGPSPSIIPLGPVRLRRVDRSWRQVSERLHEQHEPHAWVDESRAESESAWTRGLPGLVSDLDDLLTVDARLVHVQFACAL